MKPLIKKLKKCRDPDRFDLIALHKKRLEFRENDTKPAKGPMDDGAVFGGGLNSGSKGDADHGFKRRKVAADDPFGPPL